MGETARSYLSLSQYFQMGMQQQRAMQTTGQEDVDVGDEDVGLEDAGEEDGEEVEGGEDEGKGDEAGEDEAPGEDSELDDREGGEGIESGGIDRENRSAGAEHAPFDLRASPKRTTEGPSTQADSTDFWTSLPGVHTLPEEDFLEARTQDSWPHRLDPAAKHMEALRGGVRGRGRPPGRSRGRRGWKWALKGTEHENLFQSARVTAEAAGTKRRGRGGRQKRGFRGSRSRARRPQERPDPGEEFKALQAQATSAFLENKYDEAIDLALQAVTKNAEVPAPHFLIDQVMMAQGREREAMEAHYLAAIAARDVETWLAVSDRFLEADAEDKTRDHERAFVCLSEALKLDPSNTEIRQKKVELFIETKQYKHAFRECRAMMKINPGDTNTLWQFAELLKLAKTGKPESRAAREERAPRVVEAYRTAFHAWRASPVFGDVDMQWAHLDMYIGLLEETGHQPHDCIRELKQISRWLLGRGHEVFWDSLGDDREYDVEPDRRIATDFFRMRMFNLDEPRYGQGLPVWLRAKLGYMRAAMGFLYKDEAERHFNVLLNDPAAAADNPETFVLTAERLASLRWYHDAAKLYEAVKEKEHAEAHRYFYGMGTVYGHLNRTEDAEKAFLAAVEADGEKLDARIELARLYAQTGRKAEAAKIAHAVSNMGREGIQRSEKRLLSRLPNKARGRPRKIVPADSKKAGPAAANGVNAGGQSQGTTTLGAALQAQAPGSLSGSHEMDEDVEAEEGSSDDETESLVTSAAQGLQQRPPHPRKGRLAYEEEMQQLRLQRARVQASYEMVKNLWPFIDSEDEVNEEAVRQWMNHAEAMAKEFTSTKVFYPTQPSERFAGLLAGKNSETRHVIAEMDALRKQMRDVSMENAEEADTAPSTDDKTAGDFHDISFQEWHRILSDLALQYTRFANQEACNTTIDALTRGNVFRHDFTLFNTTLALTLYCAIAFNDRARFLDASRQYLYQSDYRSGAAFQLYAAAGALGHGQSPFDTGDSKIQQWTQRLVKMQDMLVMDPEMRARWEWTGMDPAAVKARSERLGEVDDGLIPGLLVTYAHIVTSKRRVHSSSALVYLFRALALTPDDAVVNLSLATNYILDGLRRSRPEIVGLDTQKTLQQGLGFFYRYYNARVATGQVRHRQEAEYNAARIWDLLGWKHLAARGYEKVLGLSKETREEAEREGRGDEVEDVAAEAAFALQRVFVAAGNEEAARAVGEEWLVM